MGKGFQITVVVASYNPDKDKLFSTLKSILLQENIAFQIVIADDGSKEPYFEEIKQFFRDNSFKDYVIVANPVNEGTVTNIFSGVKISEGEYIKLLSPGDMLYGAHVLAEWVEAIVKNRAQLSFSDSVYYKKQDEKIIPVSENTHPYNVKCYIKKDAEKARYNYLIHNDLFLGAATICKRDIMIKYLEEINGKVIYAEDNIYRLMQYDRIPIYYFAKKALIYEIGTGVSTSGNEIWKERLNKDWTVSTSIMLGRVSSEDKIDRLLKFLNENSDSNFFNKVKKAFRVRGWLFYRKRCRWIPRMTQKSLPEEFLDKIMRK